MRYFPFSPTFCQKVGVVAGPPELYMPVFAVGANPRVCAWLTRAYSPASLNAVAKKSYGGLWVFSRDRKSTRLNSSHTVISYAVFCLKKKNNKHDFQTERISSRIFEGLAQ